ncbi:PREDICTED: GDSL esterase/lipase 7 [Theobroma cacao]|uniref:GDSL esterase/lipase 7 n=1 Tax=Theobroma cacao TaxID=3641 RepID=A0AB32WB37_THECC|nr:PREDICTED: GDSL esterase/lipase 7 [Theobroma cacao]
MSNLISSFLFAFLHFFLLIHSKPLAPALYVFGDSLFDSGNNNHLPTLAKANYPPYGQNFVQHFTGRFTNGRTLPDFIAELLELPYPPPYLSINESITLSGLNYASSACGILPETGSQLGKCLSLGQQIDFFQSTVESKLPSHFKSSKELSNYLAKSIFMLTMGSNDYIQSYFEPTLFSTSQDFDPQTYAQLLIDALSKHLERLYELGARKLIMLEIPPLGCIPHYTRRYELTGKCHEETNQIVSFFNSRLHPMLKNLTSTLRGGVFILAPINSLVYDLITNPSKYGFTDTSNPCCTTWANGTLSCIPFLEPCPNPNAHFFWDGYHNTETGNSIAASLCFNDPEFCSPISIRELLQI